MARVAVVFTGGTISTAFDAAAGGNVPVLDGAGDPRPDAGARRDRGCRRHRPRPDAGQPLHVRDAARDRGRPRATPWPTRSIDGAVVVQGTDTIEETASAGTSSSTARKPVVVTGAMRASRRARLRRPGEPARRGPRRGRRRRCADAGVVVCLAGTIEPADDVIKMHASALDTFASPNGGSLGRVDGSGVTVLRQSRRPGGTSTRTRAAERVHLVTATVAMDGSLLDAAVAAGADGFVVAATGAGNTDPALLAAAERAMAAGIPVALASRCPPGAAGTALRLPRRRRDLGAGRGAAGRHTCARSRPAIALALGLGAGLDRDGLAAPAGRPATLTDRAARHPHHRPDRDARRRPRLRLGRGHRDPRRTGRLRRLRGRRSRRGRTRSPSGSRSIRTRSRSPG